MSQTQVRPMETELGVLRKRLNEDIKSGIPPHIAYGAYVTSLLELVMEVYVFEKEIVREMHELLSEMFKNYLGIPPPPTTISDKTPSEYLNEVLQYTYNELSGKIVRTTKLQVRQEIELKVMQIISVVCELVLTMYAPPHIA